VHDDFPFDFAVIDVSLSECRTDNEQRTILVRLSSINEIDLVENKTILFS